MKRWGMAFLLSARCTGASLRLLPVSTFRSLSLRSRIGGVAAPDGITHIGSIPDSAQHHLGDRHWPAQVVLRATSARREVGLEVDGATARPVRVSFSKWLHLGLP